MGHRPHVIAKETFYKLASPHLSRPGSLKAMRKGVMGQVRHFKLSIPLRMLRQPFLYRK